MEAHGHFGGKLSSRRAGSALANRRTPMLVALVCAVLAGILIYLFVSHYSKTTTTVEAPTSMTVFVARSYIPAGMSEETIAAENLLKPVQIPISQAIAGAISDPSEVVGDVTTSAVATGQQVTGTDFVHGSTRLATLVTGGSRAMAVALDSEHGLTSYLQPGDHVNIMGGKGSASELIFQNISVLENAGGNVVLKMTDKQALMLDADLGNSIVLWMTLRPAKGAKNTVPTGLVVKP